MAGVADHSDLWPFAIYRAVVGSRAQGLDDDQSDTDLRGAYLPPARLHWSFDGVPEQLEDDATQTTLWELQKFLRLALKANPNVLECLWSPLVEHAAPVGEELRERRAMFLSRVAHQTFGGYATAQFRKLSNTIARGEPAKPKHVMHLLRLLLTGVDLLRTGELTVRVADEHRDRLLAIKRGDYDPAEAEAWRLWLHEQLDAALAKSPLPESPDVAAANDFLLRARRQAVEDAP